MFGNSGSAEIIVQDGSGVNNAFYDWLYEGSTATTCQNHGDNGHRWFILTTAAGAGIGMGTSGSNSTGDFGYGSTNVPMPPGSHYHSRQPALSHGPTGHRAPDRTWKKSMSMVFART